MESNAKTKEQGKPLLEERRVPTMRTKALYDLRDLPTRRIVGNQDNDSLAVQYLATNS